MECAVGGRASNRRPQRKRALTRLSLFLTKGFIPNLFCFIEVLSENV